MSTHTPGQWVVDNCGRVVRAGDIGGLFVARIYAVPQEDNPAGYGGEQFANARLIAAAPNLLEAAKHAVMEWRLHGQLTDSCRVLDAAVAKAEGRTDPPQLLAQLKASLEAKP